MKNLCFEAAWGQGSAKQKQDDLLERHLDTNFCLFGSTLPPIGQRKCLEFEQQAKLALR